MDKVLDNGKKKVLAAQNSNGEADDRKKQVDMMVDEEQVKEKIGAGKNDSKKPGTYKKKLREMGEKVVTDIGVEVGRKRGGDELT